MRPDTAARPGLGLLWVHLEHSSNETAEAPPQHDEPLVLARSAAALQRLVVRRGGIWRNQDLMEHCCILVHTAKACAATQLATLLAGWLHWYGRLDLQTAIQVRSCLPCLLLPLTVLLM